ncbi:MAG: 50S ribosomal protein L25 [Tepidisphaeraceae bacterium]|jgi:large subunit ribosomal protein L25
MAVQSAQVQVKKRGELGSRANKKLRDAGFLPGVVYGHKEEVVPVTLPRKEVVNHLNKGAHVFDLHMEGKSEKVLVKEVQYDHLGTNVIHVDFARVSLDEKVKVSVALELKGVPKGEADGGVLQQIVSTLEVECLVTEIPDIIRHNVAEMGLNSVLHLKEIALPAGVKALQDGELIVATVKEIIEVVETTAAEGETAEPEVIGRKAEPEAGEEGAAGKEGAAKAPAEGKK